MGLPDALDNPNKKQMLVDDCVKLIDETVASKSGIGGLGWKAAYAAVKGIKPGYVAAALEGLLPQILAALDPIWSEGIQEGDPVKYLSHNRSRVADAILNVTDARIKKTQNGIVRGSYKKLRDYVQPEVEEVVPGLAKIVDNYTKI